MKLPDQSTHRLDLWIQILNQVLPRSMAEIGVWKGDFAAAILKDCPSITRYVMVDPWAQLPDWNKPFNVTNRVFQDVYDEAMRKTEFAAGKRYVLKGRTKDVLDRITNESLDVVYIDGDHTLRGITTDLITLLPKVRQGGLIGGDDFELSPWQHAADYEPTLVCPFAVYFAEAMDLPITALPHGQFMIENSKAGFRFTDTTGTYGDLSLNKFPSKGTLFMQRVRRHLKKLSR